MTEAPLMSTFVAVALIPVAVLFTHAYLSGRRSLQFHSLTGTIGILWDLSLSIFYMLYRTFGGAVEGSTLEIEGALLAYFIIHGIVAMIVIGLESVMLATGLMSIRRKRQNTWHRRLAPYMYVLWFGAFLSGEAVYLANYVL